jgi:hypothetical protein
VPELNIEGILQELVEEGVEFLVIGGVAIGYDGHLRQARESG